MAFLTFEHFCVHLMAKFQGLLYFRGKLLGGQLKGGDDLAEPKWINLKSASKQENLRPAFVRVLEKVKMR